MTAKKGNHDKTLGMLRGQGDTRERYTHLSWEVEKIVREAEKTPAANFDKLFARADAMFSDMNRDCVQTAKR